ncbi:AraC family transcriptional regulator [Pelagibacterium sp. H642]|uniref:AraC family transcriptional regulator n=1 Tax=Pelagibacterium sp. H642 TaxID=1881069 RepID=UPI0028157454|nr:AraC family transcriptional regulator [Pelagibacterium sp. H642]WMT91042.1 AraC family transcriptional regulator [Pelagibacterium sp. H642]
MQMHMARVTDPCTSLTGSPPVNSGRRSMDMEIRREGPFAASFGAASDLIIIRHMGGEMTADVYYSDRVYTRSLPEGGVLVVPPNAAFRLRCAHRATNLYAALALPQGTAVARSHDRRPDLSRPMMIASDAVLGGLLDMAQDVLDLPMGAASGLLDSLASVILCHLARSHAEAHGEQQRLLSNADQTSSTMVTRAVEYMIGNLDRSITLNDVGNHVRCSASHLGRLFKTHLRASPHRYLLGLRVERAQLLLAATSLPIAHIALECGFASQEHLTRHFRRLSGTTPAAYRRAQTQA